MARRKNAEIPPASDPYDYEPGDPNKELGADDPPYNGPMPEDSPDGSVLTPASPDPEPEGEADPPPEVMRKQTRKTLSCRLTDAEFLDRAVWLAKTTQDLATLESRHANIKAEMKAELAKIAAEQSRLAGIVARREEMRDVGVEIVYDFPSLSVYEVRKDTGEEMNRRAMTESERQMPLPV